MFTTFAVLLATAAAAQAATSPYIPTSASTQCQTYLTQLDADPDLAQCTSALTSATSGYGPNGNLTSASKEQISSTLSTLCSSSLTSSCSQSLITGKLASFYAQCGPELTSSPNEQVKTMYDSVYFLLPLLSAVCTKDNSGAYCVPQANVSSSSNLSPAVKVSRRDGSATAYMPNATTIDQNNVLLLFLTSTLPKDELCTDCTAAVLKSYMTFEAGTNYAPGLAQSVLMSHQPVLYQSVVSTCGADFLSGAVKAAGSLGQGSSTTGSSGALPTLRAGSVLAMLAGALASTALLL